MNASTVSWTGFVHLLLMVCCTEAKFTIDYENNTFSLDGKPFRYVSGSAHYFRMPNQYWRDRLRKMRAAGLNAVSTYVEWSQHEPIPGRYEFSGDLDVIEFLTTAQEEGLYVILRPGPYICAERDMGGLPYWLIHKNPDVSLRSSDPKYTEYVEKWLNLLLTKISPLLHGNGGPIILVQVENEYGYFEACDHKHNIWLRDLFKGHIQDKAVLFTTDTPNDAHQRCGKIPDVYATVDFGALADVERSFAVQRQFEPKGPLVNSEFYPGWLTHWGENMANVDTKKVVTALRQMLEMGANVNFYMFFGGTNFGFTAGANFFVKYQSDITSYDYDAPISEAGDLTEKYYAIKAVLAEFLPPVNISVKTHEKGKYGELTLKRVASLLSPHMRQSLGVQSFSSKYPLTFETLNQNFGYLLYETRLPKNMTVPTYVKIQQFNDYANAYINGKFHVALSRENYENKIRLLEVVKEPVLSIMVENLGRINFGELINERKGILSNVTLEDCVLDTWTITSFPLHNVEVVEECFKTNNQDCYNSQGFCFYMTTFTLPEDSAKENNYLLDSYLDVTNLNKGLVFINGFNLGRYWSSRGPQYTLYVPGVHLKPNPEKNVIIVMDETIDLENINVKFKTTPSFKYE